jgi:hypothetical protein
VSNQAIVLPPEIKRRIAKLPDASRDIVAQALHKEVKPPIVYEEAIKQLAAVRDIETVKRVLFAAEGLALWAKIHEDNRAAIEAQKLKAHALRQMFICAKLLGEPYEVLLDKKIYQQKARRGEELASFPDKTEIDAIADELGGNTRPEYLVGKIARLSPLFRATYEENARQNEESERIYQEREAQKAAKPAGKLQKFMDEYGDPLISAEETILKISSLNFGQLSPPNKKFIRERIASIMELLDQIDQGCQ